MNRIIPAILTAFVATLVVATLPVFAQGVGDLFGVDAISDILKLPEGDPRTIVVRLINVALQFLGILTLVVVLWGGVLFLLSGGKKENVDRAVGVIKNAIIGLIIILSAWGISRFVLEQLVSATTDDEATISDILPLKTQL